MKFLARLWLLALLALVATAPSTLPASSEPLPTCTTSRAKSLGLPTTSVGSELADLGAVGAVIEGDGELVDPGGGEVGVADPVDLTDSFLPARRRRLRCGGRPRPAVRVVVRGPRG